MSETIRCAEAVRRLWDYLDHYLLPEDSEKVEQHLSFCRRCCGELEFAKELRRLLASRQAEDVPPDVKAGLQRLVADL
jgi:anti-sigma factor (TIGR02949 family)